MPKLQTTDGKTVADELTSAEVSELNKMGVDVDLSGMDGDEDIESDESDTVESTDERPDTDSSTETPDGDVDGSEADGYPDDADTTELDESGSDGDGDVCSETPGDDFADRDMDEMLEDEFDVDMDSVREPDTRDRARWAELMNQLSKYGQNIPRRKRERDRRIGNVPVRESGSDIRMMLKQDGVISDLKNGFQKLVSRPAPRPARSGSRMDMNNVVRRASGDNTVRRLFEEDVQVETGDRCIGLATDISGSMGADMVELKKAGAAIAEATEIIGDGFVWQAFTDRGSGGLDLRIVTGPQESFRYEQLDSFSSEYNEPTAAGIRDCRMLMERTAKYEYTMIVITDGKALVDEDGVFCGYSNVPVEQAREAVAECRESGIEVIGLGIGGMSEQKMTETFGEGNYRLTDINSLAEDIIELYGQMMNVNRSR